MSRDETRTPSVPMLNDSHVVPLIRLTPFRSTAAVLWGEAPVLFATLAISGLLWGTGHDLPSATAGPSGLPAGRAGVAWLAAAALVLLFTYPLLGLAGRLIRGFWPRRGPGRRLAKAAIARRTWRQHERVTRAAAEEQATIAERGKVPPPPSIAARSEGPPPPSIAWRGEGPPPLEYNTLEYIRRQIAWRFTPVVRPTRLGDAEAAVASRVARRYGLDLGYAWPRLASLIPEPERGTLADAERSLDAAVFAAAGWLIAAGWLLAAAIGVVAAQVAGGDVVAIFTLVGAAGALALCLNSYRRAVDRTIAHGRLVESAVDLHRLSLLDALGWRRPKNEEEERHIFQALSAALAHEGDTSRYRQYAAPAGDAAVLADMREALDTVVAEVPQAVTAGVLGSVEQGLRERLDQTLSNPQLTNFYGHLSAALLNGDDPVRPDDEGVFGITREQEYRLVITIGQRPEGPATVPVCIRGGNDDPEVPFAISIDSNVAALRENERPLIVYRDGTSEFPLPLRVTHTDAETVSLWIRVTQYNRTIQNLELVLSTVNPPA